MDEHTVCIWPTFLDWWDLYQYKLDRKRCERLWNKMTQAEKETAMTHTERYVESTFTNGQFPSRRHPGTYLQNANWNDEALIRDPSKRTALDTAAERASQYFANRSKVHDGYTG